MFDPHQTVIWNQEEVQRRNNELYAELKEYDKDFQRQNKQLNLYCTQGLMNDYGFNHKQAELVVEQTAIHIQVYRHPDPNHYDNYLFFS